MYIGEDSSRGSPPAPVNLPAEECNHFYWNEHEYLTEPLVSVLLTINRKKISVCEQERKRQERKGRTLHKN